jgi:hypothetical protein
MNRPRAALWVSMARPSSIVCLGASVGLPNSSFTATARARLQGYLINQ